MASDGKTDAQTSAAWTTRAGTWIHVLAGRAITAAAAIEADARSASNIARSRRVGDCTCVGLGDYTLCRQPQDFAGRSCGEMRTQRTLTSKPGRQMFRLRMSTVPAQNDDL